MSDSKETSAKTKAYLDPSTYYSSSSRLWLLYNFGLYRREILLFVVIIFGAVGDYLLNASWQEAVTVALVLSFLGFNGIGPTEASRAAREYTSRGQPLPKSFTDLQEWFSSSFAPMGIAAGVGLALVIYGWSNPPQLLFRDFPTTQIFAFVTNVCIMSSVSAWSWSYALKKIARGEFNRIWGGLVVLIPLGLISAATAAISITSGLAHWQDSICTYLPGTALSFYTILSTSSPGFMSPAGFRRYSEELESRTSELQTRLQWLETQEGRETGADYLKRVEATKADLVAASAEIERGKNVLSTYDTQVSKVIARIIAYEARRGEREAIRAKGQVTNGLDAETKSKIDEAISTLAAVPSGEPKPYTGTPQFRLFKEGTTVMNFPLILQVYGFYLPTVSKPEVLKMAQDFDRSTYEGYALASFEYFLRGYEAAEVVWLWNEVQNEASAKHCATYVRDCYEATREYLRLVKDRMGQIQILAEKDPESQYTILIPTTTGSGPGLASGRKIAEKKFEVISTAHKTVEPLLTKLGIDSSA